MRRFDIVTLESPNRAPLRIEGFIFGEENTKAPSVAIVGAMSGDHINQLYVASGLVEYLRIKEEEGKIVGKILVIPAVNAYALNMGEKNWPLDKTDINTMFPGYDQGETTQRIAGRLFETLKGYDYGIILEGRRDQGMCIPYVKLIQSGYEDIESVKDLGIGFVHYRAHEPVETVMLQYNWQLWETKAFSIVFGKNGSIDQGASDEVHMALVRFLSKRGMLDFSVFEGRMSNIIDPNRITILKASRAGIFISNVRCGAHVQKGEVIGKIIDALSGERREKLLSPCEGIVTCQYSHPLIFQNSIAFRIASVELNYVSKD
ncbi:MAG: M14 family metallopeptidase [Sulfuricurvum sp.]|uniref:M14 family metallopeptidase n=1 Tax=Sulfuricurvum sp. TaxID=2025608 RepID=UPI00261DC9E0|nr:M14 family metallopeptidase [Sulfuricurvum sp.]MDD2829123.1 M14 family metallopeptidase [Sulfuricurvum sp.]MDD4950172.1 M14 family metallopeptidase [Sulfuricurvum sp.]